MDTDINRPVTAAVRADTLGGHVHLHVWVGRTPGARGKAGTLTVTVDEWPEVREMLTRAGFEMQPEVPSADQ